MTTRDGGWFIPPPSEPEVGHVDSQTQLEQDALLIYRCCKIARKMAYDGHLTAKRQEVVEQCARRAYVRAYLNLAQVQKWTGGVPLQLLAAINVPHYWRTSRQLVWVMGEIGKPHPLAFNLRDQLKRAIEKWNAARSDAATAVYIDEQDMGGDHG